jgi:copper chaperone
MVWWIPPWGILQWMTSQPTATTTYLVDGMTCAHCVASVREEVGELAGVEAVDVSLEDGRLTVAGPVAEADVRAAVAEAGYILVRAA